MSLKPGPVQGTGGGSELGDDGRTITAFFDHLDDAADLALSAPEPPDHRGHGLAVHVHGNSLIDTKMATGHPYTLPGILPTPAGVDHHASQPRPGRHLRTHTGLYKELAAWTGLQVDGAASPSAGAVIRNMRGTTSATSFAEPGSTLVSRKVRYSAESASGAVCVGSNPTGGAHREQREYSAELTRISTSTLCPAHAATSMGGTPELSRQVTPEWRRS